MVVNGKNVQWWLECNPYSPLKQIIATAKWRWAWNYAGNLQMGGQINHNSRLWVSVLTITQGTLETLEEHAHSYLAEIPSCNEEAVCSYLTFKARRSSRLNEPPSGRMTPRSSRFPCRGRDFKIILRFSSFVSTSERSIFSPVIRELAPSSVLTGLVKI